MRTTRQQIQSLASLLCTAATAPTFAAEPGSGGPDKEISADEVARQIANPNNSLPGLVTNLTYVQTELHANYLGGPNSIKGGWVAHANLIWKVTKVITTGIEDPWGERKNTNGAIGDAARAQPTVQYYF